MKVLLDTCVSGFANKALVELGHDVVWSGEWASDPGDESILATAFAENRVLVTLDKDFGELAMFKGHKHCGIIRLVQVRAVDQGGLVSVVLARYEQELSSGAIITVEPTRTRVRLSDQ